jgi:hypothetical protein
MMSVTSITLPPLMRRCVFVGTFTHPFTREEVDGPTPTVSSARTPPVPNLRQYSSEIRFRESGIANAKASDAFSIIDKGTFLEQWPEQLKRPHP